jgi:predicted nucleic acid-binding protein
MTRAVVDTTVLYAAGNRRASRHETALAIVREADRGHLPELIVPDPILVETMNGLARDVGHETATDFLARLQRSGQFDVRRAPDSVWQTGLDLFGRVSRLSLADAILVASARHDESRYVYSFDDNFDGLDGFTRLATADDPFA